MTLSFLSCKPIAFSKKKIHCPKFLTFNIIVLVEQARFAPNCKSGAGVDLKAVSGGTFEVLVVKVEAGGSECKKGKFRRRTLLAEENLNLLHIFGKGRDWLDTMQ